MASTDKDVQRRRGTTYVEELNRSRAETYYDYLLDHVEKLMGTEMTWDSELEEYVVNYTNVKLRGVFGRTEGMEELNVLRVGEGMIVNTKDAPGEHWVAFFRFESGNIFMYDSFGRSFNELFDPDDSTVDNTEDDAEQELVEDNCGQRCIAWLILADDAGEEVAKWI